MILFQTDPLPKHEKAVPGPAKRSGSSRRERKKIAQDKPAAKPRGRSPGNPCRSIRKTKYAAQPRANPPLHTRCHPEQHKSHVIPSPQSATRLCCVIPSEAFFSGAEGSAFAFCPARTEGPAFAFRSRSLPHPFRVSCGKGGRPPREAPRGIERMLAKGVVAS